MLSLGTLVAIAASGAATIVVLSVICVVVWVRVRKERHALRLLGLRHGQYTRSIGFTGDTLTELSREEGTALRAHGLPYGKPTEWGQIASRETLIQSQNPSDSTFPLIQKARSFRNSISRSRSKRLSRSSNKHSRMSSVASASDTVLNHTPSKDSDKEDIPLSAVEGVLELPAERTPRQTPDLSHEEPGFHLGMRPVSPGWPLPSHKERSGLFPVMESRTSQEMFDPPRRIIEESPTRLRGGSIASQNAGMAPEAPIPPPPPTAFPLDRMSYLRNDSIMRLSSMSLDTTNSSILEESRNGPRSADTDLTSPIFPSCGTSVPFSANDVGVKNGRRSFISANTSMMPLHNFPIRSSSTAETRRRSSLLEPNGSPRRSMTTNSRNPSTSSENRFSFTPIPRNNDPAPHPQRRGSLRSGTPVSINGGYQTGPAINWRHSNSSMTFAPGFSQMQQPAVWEGEHRENDPFYGGSPPIYGHFVLYRITWAEPSPMQRSSLSLRGQQPLQSALKGSNSQRKGHRRQNCVRISIHPPITFGGSAFSPTVEEEPEDLDAMEELDLRGSAINGNFQSLPALPPPIVTTSPSPLSKRSSRRNKPAPSILGPLAEEPAPASNKGPEKKSTSDDYSPLALTNPFNKAPKLPELLTSLPPVNGGNLTHTPSPEYNTPVWTIPEDAPSPLHENMSSTSSPRRTPIKGPRSQPGRSSRSNSTPKPMEPLLGPGSPTGLPLITGTQGSDWRKSTDATDSSLASILGSMAISPSPKTTRQRSGTVRDRVTIWEDANRSGSPPKASGAQFTGNYTVSDNNTSPLRTQNSIPRTLSKNGHSPTRTSSQRAPPTPISMRRGMTTPTGKALGLGIGCTGTPVSLYDGDGFLRE
ncbi:uncharacterized protein N7483_002781 [Penicillium malachiteum]|uniref:uncharacterized protein n=1 Tax=Penicillium malachiteum TaxID=1324776 RepID=UPI002548636A|nr:uncharacterized protein N7483_002781 [Penicillium malachiteum]KAJ5737656.1 hypothetical protein N7483_002781 [Penicillium malachiteum]